MARRYRYGALARGGPEPMSVTSSPNFAISVSNRNECDFGSASKSVQAGQCEQNSHAAHKSRDDSECNDSHRTAVTVVVRPGVIPMTDIDVAVIIVTYKTAALTIECLHSIVAERSDPGLQIRAIVSTTRLGMPLPSRKPLRQMPGRHGSRSLMRRETAALPMATMSDFSMRTEASRRRTFSCSIQTLAL